jgi:hypothetical protein
MLKQRLSGLRSLRKERKKLNGRNQFCIVFQHDDFPHIELFFKNHGVKLNRRSVHRTLCLIVLKKNRVMFRKEQNYNFQVKQLVVLRISFFRAAGFDVDNDNDPAPENIPAVKRETVHN